MKPLIIVQARMGSERLPGKVLMEVLGRPLLSFLLERLKDVPQTNLIVATTINPKDNPIVELCKKEKVKVYRGSESNVLDRYYQAALENHAEVIVRVTGDCPCIDPDIIKQVIDFYQENTFDYVSNTLQLTFPRGMDVEVFSFEALEKAHREATTEYEKEHVTPYIYNHPKLSKLGNFAFEENASKYRLTVDTPEDFELISLMLRSLYPINPKYSLDDMLILLQKKPEWAQLNAHIRQKTS